MNKFKNLKENMNESFKEVYENTNKMWNEIMKRTQGMNIDFFEDEAISLYEIWT